MCCQSGAMNILHWCTEHIDSIDSCFILVIMVRLDENLWE